jgi:N-acetylmuramoyl-L-alanine amidase
MTLKVSNEAGHAGFGVTPGKRALDGSMYEWEFNDGCVRHFMDELSQYEGVEQLRVDDPTGKRDVPLAERAQRANSWGANLHISFHGNAGATTASGIETFVYPSTSAHNRHVALTIHNHIINATGRKNRGLKTADFQILRTTKMEALLIEGGFMTNAEELALMKTDAYRSKVGRAVAAGVAECFSLKKKAVAKPPTDSADGKLVRGERGPNVKQLNLWLNELTYTFKTDDLFDQYTEAALKAFQKDYGLPQDGIYTSPIGDVMLKAIKYKKTIVYAKSNAITLDEVPAKRPEKYRLAKLVDTNDLALIDQLRKDGYKVIEVPKEAE